jgi:hypothetical protein
MVGVDMMTGTKLTDEYDVLTPNGFQPFVGIQKLKKALYEIKTKSHSMECSYDHPFVVGCKTIKYSELNIGDIIDTVDGQEEILELTDLNKVDSVYDVLEVSNGNTFFTNGILSHNCMFLETGHSAVDANLIELYRAISCEPIYKFEDGNYKVWKEPNPEHLYSIGVDVGEGIGQAASVAQVLDITDLTDIQLVATYHNNLIDPFHFGEMLNNIANQWGRPMLAIERNNCGGQVIDALKQTHSYHNIIDHTPKTMAKGGNYYSRLGIYSHTNSKYQGIINMRYWVNSLRAVKVYDVALVQELETFVRYPNGTWKGKPGDYIYDDRVLALVWGLFVLEKEIAEQYYEVSALDDRGKPAKIQPVTIEESKYFKLDRMYIDDPNAPMPSHVNTTNFGVDPTGIDSLEDQGWEKIW